MSKRRKKGTKPKNPPAEVLWDFFSSLDTKLPKLLPMGNVFSNFKKSIGQ